MSSFRIVSVLGLAIAAATTGCATTSPTVADLRGAAVRVDPAPAARPAGTAAGHYSIGAMALAGGRHASAVARFRAALELDPAHVEALNGLGVAYGETGRHGEAVASFERALQLAPDAAHVLSNLGYAQLRAGRLADAWRSLSRSFELDPSSPRTRANLLLAIEGREQAPAAGPASRSVRIESAAGDSATLRVEPTMRIGPTQPAAATSAPAAATRQAARPPDVPQVAAPYAVVGNRPDDPGLVRVAESVYELRPSESAVAAAPSPDVRTASVARPRLEVSNGIGVSRLATRTALELARIGYPTARVTNALPYGARRSKVLVRPGHEAQAQALVEAMGIDAPLVPATSLAASVDVRLVLGLDLVTWEQASRLSAPGLASASTRAPAPIAWREPAVIATAKAAAPL